MDIAQSRPEDLREAAIHVGAAELDAASGGFYRRFPARSAKRRFHATQIAAFALLLAGLAWAFKHHAGATFALLHALAFALFAIAIGWRLIAAASLSPMLSPLAAPASWPIYTILCPLYREANVAMDLVSSLERLDYPAHALDIKLLVEGDDLDTIAAALAAARASHVEVVIIPAAKPRTKPKALNVGLARARGDYVVVYDAEDRPHPQQLRAALAAFQNDSDGALACVQAPLVVDNAEASWIARQFAAEYAIQFREILPLLARLCLPVPLGGSSNHFRAILHLSHQAQIRGSGGVSQAA